MIEPEHLTHFWGPVGVTTPFENITVEPRPGGRFETTMVNDENGEEYPMRAVYVEIVEPESIVFTEPDVEGGMTTSITFTDLGDGRTEAHPPDQRSRDVHHPRGPGRHAEQLRPLRRLPHDPLTTRRSSAAPVDGPRPAPSQTRDARQKMTTERASAPTRHALVPLVHLVEGDPVGDQLVELDPALQVEAGEHRDVVLEAVRTHEEALHALGLAHDGGGQLEGRGLGRHPDEVRRAARPDHRHGLGRGDGQADGLELVVDAASADLADCLDGGRRRSR